MTILCTAEISQNLVLVLRVLFLSFSGWSLDVEKSVCVRALVEQYEKGTPDEQDSSLPGRYSAFT